MSSSRLSSHPFVKMNGLGNEIVIVDLRGTDITVRPAEARAIAADRDLHFDQLMALHDPHRSQADAFMRIYNNDGTESGACGNGTRCVAYVLLKDAARDHLLLESEAGLLACTRLGDLKYTVDMGEPRLAWAEIPLREPFDTREIVLPPPHTGDARLCRFSAVNMGNPHAVFFVDAIDGIDLPRVGPLLEMHPLFPQKANISIASIATPDHIDLKVWERGAGITRACGTAACATLVAATRLGHVGGRARVSLPGGDLAIEWRKSDSHVLMTGPVELEFSGKFSPALFSGLAP